MPDNLNVKRLSADPDLTWCANGYQPAGLGRITHYGGLTVIHRTDLVGSALEPSGHVEGLRIGRCRAFPDRILEWNGRKVFANSFPDEIMPSPCTRRRILHVSGVALSIGIAGCSSAEPTGRTEHDVSNWTARERALDAEGSYVTDILQNQSCLEDWGTTATTASKQATVTKRTSDGVYVEVTYPYWYTTEHVEGDSSTEARYVVTDENTERRSGDPVTPSC